MRVEFSKSALKFLKKLDSNQRSRIRTKVVQLRNLLENRQAIPFDELDIKKLKGNWQGFLRLRVGKCRIIFTVDFETQIIRIHDICFRGSAYD